MKKADKILTWICGLILLGMVAYAAFRELVEIRFLLGR